MSGHDSAQTLRPFYVMVSGSRGWADEQTIRRWLDSILAFTKRVGHRLVVMHGGAHGADVLAHAWAADNGVDVDQFLPDRSLPSPRRYHVRNDTMLARPPHVVLAFWDGKSPGTGGVIDKAKRLAIPTEIIYPRVLARASRASSGGVS